MMAAGIAGQEYPQAGKDRTGMVDSLPSEPARQEPTRRGVGLRVILGTGLVSFLLGGAAFGYMAWRGGFDLAQLAEPVELSGVVRQQAEPTKPPTVADLRRETQQNAQTDVARQAVEIVAQQQGGLDQRLAGLEQRMARLDLQAQAAAGNAGRAEALLIAFAARRAIDRGAPLGYLADQLRLRFGDAKPIAVQTVIDAAHNPVTLDKLVARLDGLGPELESAQNKSGFARLRWELSELFVIRRENAPSPAPHKRLERARWFLESGRVEAAIAEVRNLPGADEAEEWIAEAARYGGAQRALDLLETSAVLESRGLRDGGGNKIEQASPLESGLQP